MTIDEAKAQPYYTVAAESPRLLMVHDLKCQRTHFEAIRVGTKRCEVRMMDRDYRVNDLLCLRMVIDPQEGPRAEYCGPALLCRITHITHGRGFGIDSAFGVLSIELVTGETPFSE